LLALLERIRGVFCDNALYKLTFTFISFRDKEGVPKFNVGATGPLLPYTETFICALSTWQDQTVCQISASYLYASYSYANM